MNVRLRYATTDGASLMSRNYDRLPADFIKEDASLRALVESEEFRAQNSFANPAIGKPESITLENGFGAFSLTLSSDEYKGLTDAVDADLRTLRYERLFDLTQPIAQIGVQYGGRDVANDNNSRWFSLNIPSYYENTVAWLAEHGYYDRLTAWIDAVKSIRLVHYTDTTAPGDRAPGGKEEEIAVFRDPALIRAALEQAETGVWDAKDHWRLDFSVAGDALGDTAAEAGYAGDEALAQYYSSVRTLYLRAGNSMLATLLAAADR
jgi:hypothetical protein